MEAYLESAQHQTEREVMKETWQTNIGNKTLRFC